MDIESPKDIYSSMICVWSDDDRWYNYTHKYILDFLSNNLAPKLSQKSVFLNFGSGGSEYDLQGSCHHLDIAENLISKFDRYLILEYERSNTGELWLTSEYGKKSNETAI